MADVHRRNIEGRPGLDHAFVSRDDDETEGQSHRQMNGVGCPQFATAPPGEKTSPDQDVVVHGCVAKARLNGRPVDVQRFPMIMVVEEARRDLSGEQGLELGFDPCARRKPCAPVLVKPPVDGGRVGVRQQGRADDTRIQVDRQNRSSSRMRREAGTGSGSRPYFSRSRDVQSRSAPTSMASVRFWPAGCVFGSGRSGTRFLLLGMSVILHQHVIAAVRGKHPSDPPGTIQAPFPC